MANKFVIEVRAKGFTNLEQQLKKADKATRGYERSNQKLRGTTSGLRRQIGALRNNILLYTFAVGAAGKITGKFIRDASKFESVKTRLVGLTGSVQKAEQAFSKFNDVAATTPFTLDDVVNAGAQLEAFGANSQMLLKEITDLAAFMGTTATEAANSFGRAFAGGAGAADILRERGILNIIKDSQGLADLSKTTLPEFREALIKSLQDPAVGIAGSTDRLSETFEGAFSNMKDAVTLLSVEIGETLMPSIKNATVGIGNLAKVATRFLKEIKGEFDSPEFKQSIEGLLEGSMAKFQESIKDFDVKQLSGKLEELQKQLKATAPTALKVTKEVKALSDTTKILNITGIVPLASKTNAFTDGMLTMGEATTDTQKQLQATIQTFTGVKLGVDEYTDAQKVFNEENHLSMEINEQSREFILAQIEILKTLIGLKEEEANITGKVAKADDDAAKSLADRAERIKAFSEPFKSFSNTLAQAILHTDDLGDAFTKTFEILKAQVAANAIEILILSMLGVPVAGQGVTPGGLFGRLLGVKAHKGGRITNNGVQSFNTGGMVQGKDNVPILAQAGEFVIKRDSAESIGLNTLNQINETGQAGNLNLHFSGPITNADYVRDVIVPEIQKATGSNLA
tara:strand:- start:2226 stop:4106 length:1881 start_codon:yes stop_codon:yes gene_type:complete